MIDSVVFSAVSADIPLFLLISAAYSEPSPQISQAGFAGTPRSVNRTQPSPAASLPRTPPVAMTQRSSPAVQAITPSQSGLSQIARVQQAFRRDSPDRVSLSKKHMDHDAQVTFCLVLLVFSGHICIYFA